MFLNSASGFHGSRNSDINIRFAGQYFGKTFCLSISLHLLQTDFIFLFFKRKKTLKEIFISLIEGFHTKPREKSTLFIWLIGENVKSNYEKNKMNFRNVIIPEVF